MRWPWKRRQFTERLIISWAGQSLSYLRVQGGAESGRVLAGGVLAQGSESRDSFVRQLQSLGLKGLPTTIVLKLEQYQLLQIEAPAVPIEELRSAVRYQIKDMVDAHLDDLTTDVVRVGDGQGRAASQVFVAVARNALVRDVLDLAQAMQWDVQVIDVQDMAQRNLQTALEPQKASACLSIVEGRQALLTISAGGELYFSRRLDLPADFLSLQWASDSAPVQAPMDVYTPVEEYVPAYAGGSLGDGAGGASSDMDRAQRLVVEVQRSIDLWDRTWPAMPLADLQVFAGTRSAELAQWLARDTGHAAVGMSFGGTFAGWDKVASGDQPQCLELLGAMMRTDTGF